MIEIEVREARHDEWKYIIGGEYHIKLIENDCEYMVNCYSNNVQHGVFHALESLHELRENAIERVYRFDDEPRVNGIIEVSVAKPAPEFWQ